MTRKDFDTIGKRADKLIGNNPEADLNDKLDALLDEIKELTTVSDDASTSDKEASLEAILSLLEPEEKGINLSTDLNEKKLADGGNSRTNEKEKKTRRANLIFRPSTFEDFSRLAKLKDTSVNDLINTIIENTVNDNAEVLEAMDKLENMMK